jgi:hypothetical protein
MRVLSAHLVLGGHPTLEQAQSVGDQVKRTISRSFSISHSTLELECERCQDSADDPCPMEAPDSMTAHPGPVAAHRH